MPGGLNQEGDIFMYQEVSDYRAKRPCPTSEVNAVPWILNSTTTGFTPIASENSQVINTNSTAAAHSDLSQRIQEINISHRADVDFVLDHLNVMKSLLQTSSMVENFYAKPWLEKLERIGAKLTALVGLVDSFNQHDEARVTSAIAKATSAGLPLNNLGGFVTHILLPTKERLRSSLGEIFHIGSQVSMLEASKPSSTAAPVIQLSGGNETLKEFSSISQNHSANVSQRASTSSTGEDCSPMEVMAENLTEDETDEKESIATEVKGRYLSNSLNFSEMPDVPDLDNLCLETEGTDLFSLDQLLDTYFDKIETDDGFTFNQ